jgi:hypothetical protein
VIDPTGIASEIQDCNYLSFEAAFAVVNAERKSGSQHPMTTELHSVDAMDFVQFLNIRNQRLDAIFTGAVLTSIVEIPSCFQIADGLSQKQHLPHGFRFCSLCLAS